MFTHRPALACLCCIALLLAACGRGAPNRFQGYVEGEFVYVASPLPGKLETLKVVRGTQVRAHDMLFALENVAESAAKNEAAARLAQAKANLEDLKKGKRTSEMASIEAQLLQARAALGLAEKERARREMLYQSKATSTQELDRARSAYAQEQQHVAQLEADLQTAKLGSRNDQVAAAEANVRALEAVVNKSDWELAQKRQEAGADGLVFDTLYREGEWVPAGRPVVVLLPPQNIKVRTFIPEPVLGSLHLGDRVGVTVDGAPEKYFGKVSFISPQAEYTPPVIYSEETRDKLVFLVEIMFDDKTAAALHPGQPVDVERE